MARSIPGLVFRLATLHVERRPGWCAAVLALVIALVIWPRHSGDRTVEGASGLQAAVLPDGFAVAYTSGAGPRVVELDGQGQARREMPVRHAGDLRLVGTRIGAVAAWHDDKRVRLVRVEDDADVGTWGRS